MIALKGTEKQIAAATSVRQSRLAEVGAAIGSARSLVAECEADGDQAMADRQAARAAELEARLARLAAVEKAAWWLQYGHSNFGSMGAAAYAAVIAQGK